jgi:hypothetical protein
MKDAINDVVNEAGWKMKTLLRTRRFYCDAELVLMYKSHLLSFLEYRTPAIYHAKREVLVRLDNVQQRFLRDAGIDDLTALMHFNLAPLATRRDIAMLGLIHRTVLLKGPSHFREHFKREACPPPGVARRHCRHLVDPRLDRQGRVITRSALGLVAVYNLLPNATVLISEVSAFQAALQNIVKDRAEDGCEDWASSLSPRLPLGVHPLLAARESGT